ncbi:MAG TPA: DUF5700 domain-containing putative Zn-dependent protease [Pyrinomonadaceae bacterium]|nr:DUF5700 domain-containing putative Zn-dependent protease [Pyrinomonadaceae bacterium]
MLLRVFVCLIVSAPVIASGAQLDVRLVTDEPEAVLALLAKKKSNQTITEADWERIFSSEGYQRLKQRELSMQRPFEDTEFRKFVLSDDLAQRAAALEETLAKWKRADLTRSGELALAYLPSGARIRAKVYPVIKPRDNSFVFDVKTDPAIFLFLDPTVSQKKFENTLAHELHHIGYGGGCPAPETTAAIAKLSPNAQKVLRWIGGFGEGFAMLAAAGGPSVHPHDVSPEADRSRWDKDLMNFNTDLKKVESFFASVLEGKLTDEQINRQGFSFFGVQGPWYTVGWRITSLIEETFGKKRLIEVMCDQRLLLATYNEAATIYNRKAKDPLALWSDAVVTLKYALP